jgi:hypothetical protein
MIAIRGIRDPWTRERPKIHSNTSKYDVSDTSHQQGSGCFAEWKPRVTAHPVPTNGCFPHLEPFCFKCGSHDTQLGLFNALGEYYECAPTSPSAGELGVSLVRRRYSAHLVQCGVADPDRPQEVLVQIHKGL